MICQNCGNNLEDNAKFCPKCGNSVSAPNMNANQQPVNMTAPMQQQAYAGAIPKKNNILTIILGIVAAVLLVLVISMQSKISDLEYRLNQYENRNSIDKTIDAIGSWLE